jgi:hypothetical protein
MCEIQIPQNPNQNHGLRPRPYSCFPAHSHTEVNSSEVPQPKNLPNRMQVCLICLVQENFDQKSEKFDFGSKI